MSVGSTADFVCDIFVGSTNNFRVSVGSADNFVCSVSVGSTDNFVSHGLHSFLLVTKCYTVSVFLTRVLCTACSVM